MNPRLLEFLRVLTVRDAALVQLAYLALAGLLGWGVVKAVFNAQQQNRILTLGAIAFYSTLVLIIFFGG